MPALLLLLCGGAIVNVAVAWGIADLFQATSADQEVISETQPGLLSKWYIARHRTTGSLWIVAMIQLHSTDAMFIADVRVPQWSRIKRLPAYVEGEPMPVINDFAFGWPLLCMWYGQNVQRDWQTGNVISRTMTGNVGGFGLPLWFLWPGFAINTIFYTAILWVLFATPMTIRRWRRIKRGLCPACAYDLRGSDSPKCPECGRPV